jgi:apolipoprotein N-acyltransferase
MPSNGRGTIMPAQDWIAARASKIAAFLLGAVTVAGFAPFYLFPLPVLTLAWLIHRCVRQSPRNAALTGWIFSLGFFLTGVSWVYVSLHNFGGMPAPVTAAVTFLFCAFLALFPAGAAWAAAAPLRLPLKTVLLVPATWTLLEWTRGWIFSGFPWIGLGYSQIPSSPLAGYAPVVGLYGLTLLTAMTAGLIAWATASAAHGAAATLAARALGLARHPAAWIALVVWLGGWALAQVAWTQPSGTSISVTLIQGNVAQNLKWREDTLRETLELYRDLVIKSDSRLIVLPETALPLFLGDVPPAYLEQLAAHARQRGGDVLIGVPERLSDGSYYNSVITVGTSPTQVYRKSHLVAFGEYIPLRPLLGELVSRLAIPLQDFSRGGPEQQPLNVAGERVAVDICYEDAFGEEIIRQLPAATMLVNVSNVAWFGRFIAPRQHLQISQARALETGRYMLRATNTGMTAVVNQRGRIEAVAPEFERVTLTRQVPGYTGATPYVRWGDLPVLLACVLALLAAPAAGRIKVHA